MKQETMTECRCKPFNSHFDFQHEQRKIVTCTDKGSSTKYIYKNRCRDYLSKYRVDNGLIADIGAKCDFLLLNCNKTKAFFIELKGSDLFHAIEQIDRSIDLLRNSIQDYSISARVVVTRMNTPRFNSDPRTLRFKKKLYNGDLKVESRQMTETND